LNNYWLVVGSPENWRTAFKHGNIWGLKETQRHLWERLSENDKLLFYATQSVGGLIGYGVVRTKVKQDRPLWPQEIQEHKVIWPLRFEFDAEFCLPPDKWSTDRFVSKELMPRAGFQLLSQNVAEELISLFKTLGYGVKKDTVSSIKETSVKFEILSSQTPIVLSETPQDAPSHDEIKKTLVEIGRLQKFIAEEEYVFDTGRLDVVWRRVERSVPTYVFEVQVGGNVYQALGKLKHAFDLWNSHIFIVTPKEDYGKVQDLLSGTFHEIDHRLRFIELEKVVELYRRKKSYLELEKELGIF
jgi:predicted RNA-binding protein